MTHEFNVRVKFDMCTKSKCNRIFQTLPNNHQNIQFYVFRERKTNKCEGGAWKLYSSTWNIKNKKRYSHCLLFFFNILYCM